MFAGKLLLLLLFLYIIVEYKEAHIFSSDKRRLFFFARFSKLKARVLFRAGEKNERYFCRQIRGSQDLHFLRRKDEDETEISESIFILQDFSKTSVEWFGSYFFLVIT